MGVYLQKVLDDGVQIYVWEITESEKELFKLCSPIPNDELEDLQFIKSQARRKEKLAIRALLNKIFEDKVYLGHHDNGKPYLNNNPTEISITHTNRFAAIITHPEKDVGIDIECTTRDFSAAEKRALSEDEKEDISKKNRNKKLPIYWCAKEAIYKRLSLSNIDFQYQIQIDNFHVHDNGSFDATFIDQDGEKKEFELEYEFIEDHVMVWLVD
ncbi:MAG: 4'-phosphopantetheinyl transferase superfamily protein [Bacteroidales bacterium]